MSKLVWSTIVGMVGLVALAVSGLIWVGQIDEAVAQLQQRDSTIEDTLKQSIENKATIAAQGLTIIRLGNRIERTQNEIRGETRDLRSSADAIESLIRRLELQIMAR